MIRTQIQMKKEQIDYLKKMASVQHLSVAELIRRGVDILINSSGFIDIEERRRRAISAAGRFRSGISDLSEKHDRYYSETLGK